YGRSGVRRLRDGGLCAEQRAAGGSRFEFRRLCHADRAVDSSVPYAMGTRSVDGHRSGGAVARQGSTALEPGDVPRRTFPEGVPDPGRAAYIMGLPMAAAV